MRTKDPSESGGNTYLLDETLQPWKNAILSADLEDLPEIVANFLVWPSDRGTDLSQWIACINKFDEFFEKAVGPNHTGSDLQRCLPILRFLQLVAENCHKLKSLFNSWEHLMTLVTCKDRKVVIETLSLVAALGLKGGSTFKPSQWNAVLTVLCEAPTSSIARFGQDDRFDINFTMNDACDPKSSLPGVVEFLYTWTSAEGTALKISLPLPSKDADPFALSESLVQKWMNVNNPVEQGAISIPAAALNQEKHAQNLQTFAFAVRTRLQVLHELWDKDSRMQRLLVRLAASRACFESTRMSMASSFSIQQIASLVDHPLTPKLVRIAATKTLSFAISSKLNNSESPAEVLQLLAAPNPLYKWFVRSSLDATSESSDPDARRELAILVNIVAHLCRVPATARVVLSSGIISDIIPLMRIHTDFDHNIVHFACLIVQQLLDSSNHDIQVQAQRSIRTLDLTGTVLSEISSFISIDNGPMSACCQSSLNKLCVCLSHMLRYIPGSDQRNLVRNAVMPILTIIGQNCSRYGPSVFSSICHLMYSSLNIDPNSLQIMIEKGVVDLYLAAIQERSRSVVLSLHELPQLLNAMCLTEAGRSRVEATDCISHLFMMCFEPAAMYLNANSCAKSLKQSVNELLRHHRPLVPIVVDVFRSSVRANFNFHSIRFQHQNVDHCIGLRNIIHCFFSMLAGASSFCLETLYSASEQIILALSGCAAYVNQIPQFWGSPAADVFLKFFGTCLYIPGRPPSLNTDCIAAFATKWSNAIDMSPIHSFDNFMLSASFSCALLSILARQPFVYEYSLLFCPTVNVLARSIVQKFKCSQESPLNLLYVIEDVEGGPQNSRDIMKTFFRQSCEVLHNFCIELQNSNKSDRNPSSPAFSRVQMNALARMLITTVVEPLKTCRTSHEFARLYSLPDGSIDLFYSFRLNFLRIILRELLFCPQVVLLDSAVSIEIHDVLIDIFRDSYTALGGHPPQPLDDELCHKRDRTGSPLNQRSSLVSMQASTVSGLSHEQSETGRNLNGSDASSQKGAISEYISLHTEILGLISKFYYSLLTENVISLCVGDRSNSSWNDESAEFVEHLVFGSLSIKNLLVRRVLSIFNSTLELDVRPTHIDILTSSFFGIFAVCVADDDVVIFASLKNRRSTQLLGDLYDASFSERLVNLPSVFKSALGCIVFALTQTMCDLDPCFQVVRKMSQFLVLESGQFGRPCKWDSWPDASRMITRCLRHDDSRVDFHQKILQRHHIMIDSAIKLKSKNSERPSGMEEVAFSLHEVTFPLHALCNKILDQVGRCPTRRVKRSLVRCALFVAQSMSDNVVLLESSLQKIVESCLSQSTFHESVIQEDMKPTSFNNGDYIAPLLLIADILFNVLSRSSCASDHLKRVASAIKSSCSLSSLPKFDALPANHFISSILKTALAVVSESYLHVNLTVRDKTGLSSNVLNYSVRVDVPRSVLLLSGAQQAQELTKMINRAVQAFSSECGISDPVLCTYDPDFVKLNANGFVLFKFSDRKHDAAVVSVNVQAFPTSESMNAALQATFRCVNLFGLSVVSPEFRSDFIRATLTPHINVAYPMFCNQCLWLYEVFSQEGKYLEEVIDRKIHECLHGSAEGKRLHELFGFLGQIMYRSPAEVMASVQKLCTVFEDAEPRRFALENSKDLRVKLKRSDVRMGTAAWLPVYQYPGSDSDLFVASLCGIICDFTAHYCPQVSQGSSAPLDDELYGVGACWSSETIIKVLYADFLNSADSKCHPLFASVIVEKCMASDGKLLEVLAGFSFQGRWSARNSGRFMNIGAASSVPFKLMKLLCEHSDNLRHVLFRKHVTGICGHFLALEHPDIPDFSLVAGVANFISCIMKRRSAAVSDKKIIILAGEIVDFGVVNLFSKIISSLDNSVPIQRCLCDLLIQSACMIAYEAAFSVSMDPKAAVNIDNAQPSDHDGARNNSSHQRYDSTGELGTAGSAVEFATVRSSGFGLRNFEAPPRIEGADGMQILNSEEDADVMEMIRDGDDRIQIVMNNSDGDAAFGGHHQYHPGNEQDDYDRVDEDNRFEIQEDNSSSSSSSSDSSDDDHHNRVIGDEDDGHDDDDNHDDEEEHDEDDDDNDNDDDDDDDLDDDDDDDDDDGDDDDDDVPLDGPDSMIDLVSQVIQREMQGSSSRPQSSRSQNSHDHSEDVVARVNQLVRSEESALNTYVPRSLLPSSDAAFSHPSRLDREPSLAIPLSGADRQNIAPDAFANDVLDDNDWLLSRPSGLLDELPDIWEPDSNQRADFRLFSSIIGRRRGRQMSADFSDEESDVAADNPSFIVGSRGSIIIGRPLGDPNFANLRDTVDSSLEWVNPLFGSAQASGSPFAVSGDSVFGNRTRQSADAWLLNHREGRFGRTTPMTRQLRGNSEINGIHQNWHVHSSTLSRNGDVEAACRGLLERDLPLTNSTATTSAAVQAEQRSAPLVRTNSSRAGSASHLHDDMAWDDSSFQGWGLLSATPPAAELLSPSFSRTAEYAERRLDEIFGQGLPSELASRSGWGQNADPVVMPLRQTEESRIGSARRARTSDHASSLPDVPEGGTISTCEPESQLQCGDLGSTADALSGIPATGSYYAETSRLLSEIDAFRQAMNEARTAIEQSRTATPADLLTSPHVTTPAASDFRDAILDSLPVTRAIESERQEELQICDEEQELREALALSMEHGGLSAEQASMSQRAPLICTSAATPATPNPPSAIVSPAVVITPALSAHEMSEIEGTDIDATVLAELPVELRAGIIAQHRAVTRSNPATPALGPRSTPATPALSSAPTNSALSDAPHLFGSVQLDVPEGVDPDYFNQLPPDVQADVREQQRRTRSSSNPVIIEPQSLDLAATISSFPPSARADALLALPEDAIQTLSRELQDEVRSLRRIVPTRSSMPDRNTTVGRVQSASGVGHLPLSAGRHRLLETGMFEAAEGSEGHPFDLARLRHLRQLRANANSGEGPGSTDSRLRVPIDNDNFFARLGRVRPNEAPLLRCPISAEVVSTITTACCTFSLPRATFKLVSSLLRVSFFDPVCISAFVFGCNQIFDSKCPEAHVANIHKLIRSLCSVAINHQEPVFFRSHARRLAALLDTSHPVLVHTFARKLLYQASTRATLRPCLSDSLYTFSYVLLEALNRMGPHAADFINSRRAARETIVRHISSDGSITNSSAFVSSWLKSSTEPCEWIEPLDASLFMMIMRATSEPESCDDDALELCSHLLRFHMFYDQFVDSFLPILETHILSLCDTMALSLGTSSSNLSIVQLPADDIRLVRILLIISNCFDANSMQWAVGKELAFNHVSNSDEAFKSLLNVLLRVSEHSVWIRVGVSLKEQERSSCVRRSPHDGGAAVGQPATVFQSSGLARLHGMLEAFFVIHKPMGKRFSDSVERLAKLRSLRSVNLLRSEENGPMIRSDSTMGIGHIEHSRNEGSGVMPSSPPALVCSASESVEPCEHYEMGPGVNAFVDFVFTHVNVVNMFVRLKPSVLSGSLSIMKHLPMLLDFENRKSLFRKELLKRDRSSGHHRPSLQLLVKRGQVYSDSFSHLNYRSADELKAKLSVKFEGEEGADYGGLTREWYLVLSREMLNPDIGLFVPSQGSKLAFQCNPASDVIFAHDNFVHFRFVGRIVGKALYDNMLLDAHFTRAMYKAMLRLPISLSDVQDTEPEVFKSLHWLLHNDVSDLDLTFATESEKFGVLETVELKDGGSSIPVTNENKVEYVKLLSEHRLRNSVRKQMQEFLDGFHELIPLDLIPMFSPAELELLMCGLPNLDREDLRANTEYCGNYTRDSPQIQWFWRCVAEMSDEDTAKLVQFVTGTSNVPLEGFSALQGMHGPQRFQIHRSDRLELLPTAHTCFNQLDLPAYGSFETLKSMLLTAIREGSSGFGFV